MYDLTAFSLNDMITCGAELRRQGDGAGCMEEMANRTVRYFYDHFRDADGARATAMVRFFITRPYNMLEAGLQRHVDRLLGGRPPADPAIKCQTLLATFGDNPDWHSRHHSRYYKVHPLSKEIVDQNPMFAQVSEIFGIVLEQAVQPDADLVLDLEHETYNILHVMDAQDSQYVPDQKEFVIPYGIKSVLVFFSLLPSGNIFTIVLFAKVTIPRPLVDYFRPLTLNLKMAVLPFDETAVFTTDPRPAPNAARDALQYRAQAASLEQLLNVHERVVQQQSDRIAQLARDAAVAEERNRLARDLHDSVTQALYSQTLYAAAARRQLDAGNPKRTEEHLARLQETAQQALREMRLLIFELRPPALETAGLVVALQERLDAVEGRTGIETAVIAPPDFALPAEIETAFYWITQEALNNALKHARATRITIHLSTESGRVRLRIGDDGVGMDEAVETRGKLGLPGMRERVAALGGSLQIHSAPDQGTTIIAEVPYE